MSQLKDLSRGHRFDFIPEESALIICDMQRYFLESQSHAYIPSAGAIIPRIKRLAASFVEKGLPVISTRHLNTKGDAKMMARWWKEVITEDNDLSEITHELDFPDSIIILKSQYDGFYETPLEGILKEKGVHQLVITGVMTHLCCETMARSGFMRGFTVFFPIDATATYNEVFHLGAFTNLSHGFAIPVLTDELLDSISES